MSATLNNFELREGNDEEEHVNANREQIDTAERQRKHARIGLCNICASIPWEALTATDANAFCNLPKINQKVRALDKSACRICRFFAVVITSHEGGQTRKGPPYTLQLHSNLCTGDQDFSMLSFAQGDQVELLSKKPHFILAQEQSTRGPSPSERLTLGAIPIELIQNDIATCKSNHDKKCSPQSPDTL